MKYFFLKAKVEFLGFEVEADHISTKLQNGQGANSASTTTNCNSIETIYRVVILLS